MGIHTSSTSPAAMKSFALMCVALAGLTAASSLSKSSRPLAHPAARMTPRSSQALNCFDGANSGGNRVSATDYIDDLRNYNMDNRISSCCFQGIWILYEGYGYNNNNLGGMNWWAFGDNYCSNVPSKFDNAASSLRFTGAPDDMRYDTLNMYFNDYFIGDEEFTYDDYQGPAICVFPGDPTKCHPGRFATSQ